MKTDHGFLHYKVCLWLFILLTIFLSFFSFKSFQLTMWTPPIIFFIWLGSACTCSGSTSRVSANFPPEGNLFYKDFLCLVGVLFIYIIITKTAGQRWCADFHGPVLSNLMLLLVFPHIGLNIFSDACVILRPHYWIETFVYFSTEMFLFLFKTVPSSVGPAYENWVPELPLCPPGSYTLLYTLTSRRQFLIMLYC